MISRQELEELISADLDGELSPREKTRLEQLLEESEEARSLYFGFEGDRRRLRELPAATVPPASAARLKRRLGAGRGPWKLAAAVLVLTLGTLGLMTVTRLRTGTILYMAPESLVQTRGALDESKTLTTELELLSVPLQGRYTGEPTRFRLLVDSGSQGEDAVQTRISYDFDGDGGYERVETYRAFVTDSLPGWEAYSHVQGLARAEGPMRSMQDGRVKVEIMSQPDADVAVRLGSSPKASFLRLPYDTSEVNNAQMVSSLTGPRLPGLRPGSLYPGLLQARDAELHPSRYPPERRLGAGHLVLRHRGGGDGPAPPGR